MAWYDITNIDSIDSPALVLYKQRIQQNISSALAMIKDVNRFRPHVKTNKISEVCMMMMQAGIYKFKCATIAEAEMLAMLRAKDVLLAYQPVGPKANRLFQLVEKYPETQLSCLIDNFYSAQSLSAIFTPFNKTIDVFIDLNTGMNRSGIKPDSAFELFVRVRSLPCIRVIGLHAYDGHIRDTIVEDRQRKSDYSFNQAHVLADNIFSSFNIKLKIVIGGSPTFPTHIKRDHVECSPGTFVFWDWGYKHTMPDEPFEYAALVITRVISIVDSQTICTDLGHKSVAAENPLPRVYFLNAENAVPVSQSEEHMVLKVEDSRKFKTGDVLYGVPVHICPSVALYDRAMVIENNKAVDEWNVVARKRKITV